PCLRCVRQLCAANAGLRGRGGLRSNFVSIVGRRSLILRNSNSEFDTAVATGDRGPMTPGRYHALEASMKKYINLVVLLVFVLGLSALPVVAQMTGFKGVCKDQEGKFITDGVVEITNADTGKKTTLKTNKIGEYLSIGMTPGTYNATLLRNGVAVDG